MVYTHKQVINAVSERVSSLATFATITRRTAVQIAEAVIKKLSQYSAYTIIFDNGSEFTAYDLMTEALGVVVYFADPHSSWQRSSNENNNRQLRAYLPKSSDIRNLTQKELDNISRELNNEPRRRFNWHIPQGVYDWVCRSLTNS